LLYETFKLLLPLRSAVMLPLLSYAPSSKTHDFFETIDSYITLKGCTTGPHMPVSPYLVIYNTQFHCPYTPQPYLSLCAAHFFPNPPIYVWTLTAAFSLVQSFPSLLSAGMVTCILHCPTLQFLSFFQIDLAHY